jgi:exodeoxyribonuclease VII small subunit
MATQQELGFDQAIERLRQIVSKLEQGSLPLEQALQAFEEGVALARRGSSILDAAELRVEQLLQGADGADVRKPLSASVPSSGG